MRIHRRWALAAASMLLVVAVSEVTARAVESRLPPAFTFHSAEADLKVEQMDQLAATGGADVVFIGSSLVTYSMLPDVVAEDLDGRSAYNAGLMAAVPMLNEAWLSGVVLPRLAPDVVVIGLSSFDLTDDPEAFEFLAAFEDSAGGRRAAGKEGVFDRVDRLAGRHSALLRHRSSLRDPDVWRDAIFRGGSPRIDWIDEYTASITPDGAARPTDGRRFEARQADGGPRVEQWRLGTENRAAVAAMVEAVQRSGAVAVLVSVPVSSFFVDRHPEGEGTYSEFRAEVAALAADAGAGFLDYASPGIEYFADVVHLNLWGAAAFSEVLAADLRRIIDGEVPDSPAGGPSTTTIVPPVDLPDISLPSLPDPAPSVPARGADEDPPDTPVDEDGIDDSDVP